MIIIVVIVIVIVVCIELYVICVACNIVEQKDPSRYSLVWDNTQKLVQTRHHSRRSKNEMLWANAYAARHSDIKCDPEGSRHPTHGFSAVE